jgi:uncharacterized protein (DUF433 family)
MDTIQSIDLIATNPKIRGGRPCIAGTGLRVIDIAIASIYHDRSPGQIATDYGITLAEAHAALAYYYQHKQELDADIRAQIALAREYKEKQIGSRGPSLLPGRESTD